ncbi:hypothetical protein EBZ80_03500 [bacterium]|nr:hypothetical protein [bacterium]
MSKKPIDTDLYEEVKEEAKHRFAVWPSAYASGWLVRTYKARGGRYAGDRRRSPKKKSPATGIDRWFREQWVDACHYLETGRERACGRRRAESAGYPYCRPSVRVSRDTPKTLGEFLEEHGEEGLERVCRRKRKAPWERMARA